MLLTKQWINIRLLLDIIGHQGERDLMVAGKDRQIGLEVRSTQGQIIGDKVTEVLMVQVDNKLMDCLGKFINSISLLDILDLSLLVSRGCIM